MYLSGECVLIETNLYEDGSPKAHLFVIIFGAKNNTDKMALIPLCRIKKGRFHDATTIIKEEEHDFIKEPTFADYNNGIVLTMLELDSRIKSGKARRRQPRIEDDLFQRIFIGIKNSIHATYEIKSLYEDNLYNTL